MNDKKFNKIFSTVLMTLMVVVIAITTAFKLQDPQARVVMLLIAAFGSVMGVASTVLSANGILWTFFFGILDVTFCTIVAADNGLWGNFPCTCSSSCRCSSSACGSGANGAPAGRRPR